MGLSGSWDGVVLGPLPLLGSLAQPRGSLPGLFQASLSKVTVLRGQPAQWQSLGVVSGSGSVLYGLIPFKLSGMFGVLLVALDFLTMQGKVPYSAFSFCTDRKVCGLFSPTRAVIVNPSV